MPHAIGSRNHCGTGVSTRRRGNTRDNLVEGNMMLTGTTNGDRPVGSGKTALMLKLCLALRDKYSIAAVTNDIFTR